MASHVLFFKKYSWKENLQGKCQAKQSIYVIPLMPSIHYRYRYLTIELTTGLFCKETLIIWCTEKSIRMRGTTVFLLSGTRYFYFICSLPTCMDHFTSRSYPVSTSYLLFRLVLQELSFTLAQKTLLMFW